MAVGAGASVLADALGVLATFAEDGPERCSGMPVARYNGNGLPAELGHDFTAAAVQREVNGTPDGSAQTFTYLVALSSVD